MNRVSLLWDSSVGKKLILVAYLITHVLANLLVFQGPSRINAYSAFLHGTGGALWAVRLVLLAALVLHVVAAVQLAGRRFDARPVGYAAGQEPHGVGRPRACTETPRTRTGRSQVFSTSSSGRLMERSGKSPDTRR